MVNNAHSVSGSEQTMPDGFKYRKIRSTDGLQANTNRSKREYYRRNRQALLERRKMWHGRRVKETAPRSTPSDLPPARTLRKEDRLVILTMAQDRPRRHWYAAELALKTGISEARCERCLARLYACKLVVAYCHDKGRRPFTYAYFGQPLPPADG